MAQTIAGLEARWRDAAKTQAEAKQAFDETVRQMQASGVDIDSEPAVLIVRRNLEKSIADYEVAVTALVSEARALLPPRQSTPDRNERVGPPQGGLRRPVRGYSSGARVGTSM
jgi:hypothetical protein